MKNIFRLFFVMLCLLTMTIPLRSQWVQTNGPYGASVYSFAAMDSIIFAGTVGAGIYRSTDNGVTWYPGNAGMTSTWSECLAVSGNYIYAGAALGEGISLSTDYGMTWKTMNNGLPPNPWVSGATGVVDRLAASDSNVFTSLRLSPEAFYLSTDYGSNWNDANIGTISGISAIAVIGNNFFIGSSTGVYKSANGGKTWIAAGLTDSAITSFAASGTNLYASTTSAVFLSTDNGTTWASSDSGLPKSGIVALSANGSYVMAKISDSGFFLSTDNGTSWKAMGTNGLSGYIPSYLAFIPVRTTLFVSYWDGIHRSTDNGASWVASSNGLRQYTISALDAIGQTIVASTEYDVFSSSDNGMNWNQTLSGSSLLAVMDTVVFAAANSGVRASRNKGATWTTPLNTGAPTGLQYTALAVGGTNLYLGGAGVCGLCDQGGVYLSTNSGASWNKKGLENIRAIGANGTNVYVSWHGPFVGSIDNGSTWDTLPVPAVGINTFVTRGSEVFAGTAGSGVIHSTDGGKHWEYMSTGLSATSAKTVYCFAVHGASVFAGTGSGVYLLDRDDTSWIPVSTGLSLASGAVYAIAAGDSDLYVGLSGGIWKRSISEMVTAMTSPPTNMPAMVSLSQNYPNPFNPRTTINYQVSKMTMVKLEVYDVFGKKVATLINRLQTAGSHSVLFNGNGLASGVYFYRLQAGSFIETKKLVLLR